MHFTLFYLIFRLLANPSYYQLDPNGDPIQYICDLADSVIDTLQQHDCVSMQEDDVSIIAMYFKRLGKYTAKFETENESSEAFSENA